MKIAIIGYYGHFNLGDELNLLEMIKLIKRQYPDSDITVFSGALWHLWRNPPYKIVLASLLQDYVGELNKFDLVVIGGGGIVYLGANYFTFLKGIKVPYVFSRVGIDDRSIKPEVVKELKRIAQGARDFTVRTNGSKKIATTHLGINPDVVPEAIWNYEASKVELPGIGKKILVCLNTYAGEDIKKVKHILSSIPFSHQVLLMSAQEVSDDIYHGICATPKSYLIIPDTIDLSGKANCIASSDIIITSRLHVALLAISHGKPVIIAGDLPKLRFFIEDFGVSSSLTYENFTNLIDKKIVSDKIVGAKQRALGDIIR
jgi:polysaccharide pyruvyl transferase WcaK-like protein